MPRRQSRDPVCGFGASVTLGGTYSCQPGDGTTAPEVTFDYVGKHGGGLAKMFDCSVTIGFSEDSAGKQHAEDEAARISPPS